MTAHTIKKRLERLEGHASSNWPWTRIVYHEGDPTGRPRVQALLDADYNAISRIIVKPPAYPETKDGTSA